MPARSRVVWDPRTIQPDQREAVHSFLREQMPAATVVLPPASYDGADMWTVELAAEDPLQVTAFAAHRFHRIDAVPVVQVMATYVARRSLRATHASLQIQAEAFETALARAPDEQVYFCLRTRNPDVYRAAGAYGKVFPWDCEDAQRPRFDDLAEQLIRTAYRPEARLNTRDWVLHDSYPPDSVFLAPPATKEVDPRLDLSRNQCQFLLSPIDRVQAEHLFGAAD